MSMEDDIGEVLQRVRRIETRQMKLAQAQGIDPSNRRDKLTIVSYARFPVVAELSGMDVSIGDVLDTCRKSGITTVLSLKYQGRYVGQIDVRGVNEVGIVEGDGSAVVSG